MENRVENGIVLSDTPSVNNAKRAKAERHNTRLAMKPSLIERPASAPAEDKLQADAEAQRSSEVRSGFEI